MSSFLTTRSLTAFYLGVEILFIEIPAEATDAQHGPSHHRPHPRRLGHDLCGHHRVPPTRAPAAGRRAARPAGRPVAHRPDQTPATRRVVVALGRPRLAQHRALLRHALRQRLPAARRHGGRARHRPAPGRGRSHRAAPHRAGRPAHRARRCDRSGRRGPGRAHRGRPARSARPARRPGRHLVDGARPRADQALGAARCLPADLDRLAVDRGRSAAGPGRARRRGPSPGAQCGQRRRLCLSVAGRHGHGLLDLVLGSRAPAGRPGLAARPALAAGRDRGRLGRAGPGAQAGPGRRHGAGVRCGGVGSAHLSAGPRSRPPGSGSRCGRRAASPGRAGPSW